MTLVDEARKEEQVAQPGCLSHFWCIETLLGWTVIREGAEVPARVGCDQGGRRSRC